MTRLEGRAVAPRARANEACGIRLGEDEPCAGTRGPPRGGHMRLVSIGLVCLVPAIAAADTQVATATEPAPPPMNSAIAPAPPPPPAPGTHPAQRLLAIARRGGRLGPVVGAVGAALRRRLAYRRQARLGPYSLCPRHPPVARHGQDRLGLGLHRQLRVRADGRARAARADVRRRPAAATACSTTRAACSPQLRGGMNPRRVAIASSRRWNVALDARFYFAGRSDRHGLADLADARLRPLVAATGSARSAAIRPRARSTASHTRRCPASPSRRSRTRASARTYPGRPCRPAFPSTATGSHR